MKRFLWLTAWAHGSPSAEENGVETHVNGQKDLLPQFESGNEEIFSVEVRLADYIDDPEGTANMVGQSEAWGENYTAHDTVSTCVEIIGNKTYNVNATIDMK
jgi:hypothetical protein